MKPLPPNEAMLLNLFGLSGISALVYQVCWQRLLFSAFGVDIESITIIVSAFMLGLGIGALLGGTLADRFTSQILKLFCVFEIAIGLFGLSSPVLITWVADHFVTASPAEIGISNFCLLLFPTMLMGATLPMLVVHLHKTYNHVGISIGKLYVVNTLGASLGSFLVGFVLFHFLTINQTIYVAVCINFLVASLIISKLGIRKSA